MLGSYKQVMSWLSKDRPRDGGRRVRQRPRAGESHRRLAEPAPRSPSSPGAQRESVIYYVLTIQPKPGTLST